MTANNLKFFVPSNRIDRNGNPTHMDGMNEIINQNRAHRNYGARIEKQNLTHVATFAKAAMKRYHYEPIEGKAIVRVRFVEKDRRRDVSNIYGGLKYVLDALSRPRGVRTIGAGLIVDDSPKYCECIPSVEIDRDNPGIFIEVGPYVGGGE